MSDAHTSTTNRPALSDLRVALIGAGNMGGPVAHAILRTGVAGEHLTVTNSDPASSARAADQLGAQPAERDEAVSAADVVILGVKPYQILEIIGQIAGRLRPDAVVVSLAAGTTLSQMQQALPDGQPLVRAMPNTPVGVGEGAVGLIRGDHVDDDADALIHALFAQAGVVEDITEDQVHAFIGAAGSLPAFVFHAIEAMIDEAVRQGLTRPVATRLVEQTVRGSATMLLESGQHPALARNDVSSPGGTTVQGLAALDRAGVRSGLAAGMEAAAGASRRMSGD
ncbi:MAG: pyrroline-5-carboxylate reductase [Brachybacterium sp.]|nr:pyrroline-5-carboxylate reductase [Brachybacterium sp.]